MKKTKISKKKVIISAVIVLILLGAAFCVYTLVSNVKEDQELTNEKMDEIINSYEGFNKSVQKFAQTRDQYYKAKENTYLQEFAKNTAAWNTLIADYEKAIKDVEKKSKELKENCIVKFVSPNINSKCTTFKSTYEGAMNYYITDVKVYNKTVDKYNEWIAEGSNKYQKLNKANLVIYKDYIDFDKDGEYFGKEETENE